MITRSAKKPAKGVLSFDSTLSGFIFSSHSTPGRTARRSKRSTAPQKDIWAEMARVTAALSPANAAGVLVNN